MDVWDPQTLGLLVFGVFMVVSAVGMALVSLVSMRETSYEDAIDRQRRQLGRTPAQRPDRRRKEKTLENKRKTRRREQLEQDVLEPAAASASEPESEPEPTPAEPEAPPPTAGPGLPVVPELVEAPPLISEEAPPPTAVEAPPPVSSPKEKKKKKKSGKLEPAVPAAAEPVAKENIVAAVAVEAVVVATETVAVGSAPSGPAKGEEPRVDTPAKKKKARAEPEAEAAGPLPYRALLSSLTEAALSQKEVHKLMQALQQKTSGEQDVGAALKRKLEEKEKQLSNEKKDAAAAKTRLRDLTRELSAERSKMEALEAGLRAELVASGHAQATVTQQLQLKVCSLQEQLENGPSGQLTRLTQENSILRDALNQATSQAESRQNAELARLRQEVLRGAREVGELSRRNEVLQSSEERRRSLENKLSSTEQQLAQSQLAHVAKERAHQQREEALQEELRRCGDQARQQEVTIAELRGSFGSAQEELQVLKARLEQPEPQSKEQEAVLEERQRRVVTLETEMDKLKEEMESLRGKVQDSGSETESEQPFESLETDSQLLALEEELVTTRQALEQMTHRNNELQEENRTAADVVSAAENTFRQRLSDAQQAAVLAEESASRLQAEVQTRLQVLFPEGSADLQQQAEWLELVTQKALEIQQEQHTSQELLTKLKEKEQVLQTECEMNQNILAQAEQDLLSGQSRAEEQEEVWGRRLALADQQRQEALDRLSALEESLLLVNSESENKQLREQLMLLEAQLEKQLESPSFTHISTLEEAQEQVEEEEKEEQTSSQTPQEQEQEQTPQEQKEEQTSSQTPQEQEQEQTPQEQEQERTSSQTPQEQEQQQQEQEEEQEQQQERTSSQEAPDVSGDATAV